jgi:beta-galactosidase
MVTTKDNREVNVQIEVYNGTKDNDVNLQVELLDAQGRQVYQKRQAVPFQRRMKTNELKWESIRLDEPACGVPTTPISTRPGYIV